jgi:hypothetical protein
MRKWIKRAWWRIADRSPFVTRRRHVRAVSEAFKLAADHREGCKAATGLAEEWRLACGVWRDRFVDATAVGRKLRGDLEAAQERAAEADREARRMQSRAASMLNKVPGARMFADAVIRRVEASGSRPAALIRIPTQGPAGFSYKDVRLETFVAKVGLSDDCPPEMVADKLADEFRAAVLARWRGQSVLLN